MANKFKFEKWVPSAALGELEALAEQEPVDYSLLHRLATYQVMRDDVWSRVPPEKAGIVIRQVVACAQVAGAWQILHRAPDRIQHKVIKDAARSAKKLLHDIKQADNDWNGSWHLWPSDRQIATSSEFRAAFESARSAVENLATFLSRADEQYKEVIATSNRLAWVLHKKNQKKAQEIFFQRWLMNRFQGLFGKPLDAVVTALSSVVFDDPNADLETITVRGRRRSTPGAAHSRK